MEASFTREQALADPSAVNALIDSIVGPQTLPDIPDAPSDLVNLPGGLVFGGKTYKTATVRELNGNDEEALSRAMKSNNGIHFMDTLLKRGVVTIGNVAATSDMLDNMLWGDRDELLIAIRCATYGEDMVIDGWTCPHCGGQTDLKFNLLHDIERVGYVAMDNGEPKTEVELRKGVKAVVRFPNGTDQLAMSDPEWKNAERTSELLRRCVLSLTQPDGNVTHVQAFPSSVNLLGIPDRRTLAEAIYDRQPGPRFNEVTFVHGECQKEVTLALSTLDLFRELILGL